MDIAHNRLLSSFPQKFDIFLTRLEIVVSEMGIKSINLAGSSPSLVVTTSFTYGLINFSAIVKIHPIEQYDI